MRYIIEFIALLGRISMFEDKTHMSSNSTLQAACISFDYMWSYCATWALIWSVTSVVNADYNGVMISNDTEHTICLRIYCMFFDISSDICSMFYHIFWGICSMFYHMFWGICSMFYHMF